MKIYRRINEVYLNAMMPFRQEPRENNAIYLIRKMFKVQALNIIEDLK